MRSRSLLITAALVLGMSTPAWSDDRRDDARGDEHYRGRHADRGRVAALAREMESTAAWMHRQFERNNRRPNRDEARVASTLHELHDEADQFHRRVEDNRHDPRRTARELEDLRQAFGEVAESLRYISRRPYVEQGMDRIWGVLSELDRHYGYNRHGRGGRNDRYDRYDRYDRDWRRGWEDRDGRGRHGRYDDRYDRRYERDRDDDDGRRE